MKLKIVLDTNVLIASFYSPLRGPSFSRDVYDYVVENATPYVSPYILSEFRLKCAKKLKFSPSEINAFESLIRKKVLVVHEESMELPKGVKLRDVKDVPVLHLVLSVKADALLTWDKDLLVLKEVGSTKILSPKEFWVHLE